MPKYCPACERPSGDLAKKCLYCSEELSEASTDPIPSGAPRPEGSEKHLIILLTQQRDIEPLVDPYAEAFETSGYDARLALSTARPREIRRVESREEAKTLSAKLARHSIEHYVVSEKRVAAIAIQPLRRMTLHSEHFSFNIDQSERSIAFQDLMLIVVGEIQRQRYQEGLIASAKGASAPLTPGSLLYLFTRETEVAFEINPEEFDWAGSLNEASASAVVNQQRLLKILEAKNPEVDIDRHFAWETPLTARVDSGSDLSSMLSNKDAKSRGQVHDNSAQFRFYARWRYRLARHLRDAG